MAAVQQQGRNFECVQANFDAGSVSRRVRPTYELVRVSGGGELRNDRVPNLSAPPVFISSDRTFEIIGFDAGDQANVLEPCKLFLGFSRFPKH